MSFGVTIRAYRLGFRELPAPAQGWMRMTRDGDNTLCEFVPLEGPIPKKTRGGDEHVCWWDDPPEGEPTLIELSAVLKRIRRVNQPFAVMLDYHGNLEPRFGIDA